MASDDVRADARRLLQGITPAPWTSRERDWYENTSDCPEDVEIILGDDPYANPYSEIAEVKTQDWDAEDDVEMWANAEFIAAAPELVDRLLAEIDRLDTLGKLHTEVREARGAYSVALDGVKVMACDERGDTNADREAGMLRGQLDAALATLARIQAVAADVDQDGGHSGLARHILHQAHP